MGDHLPDIAEEILYQHRALGSRTLTEALFSLDDENEETIPVVPSKYNSLRSMSQALAPVEMDVQAQWKWLNGKHGEALVAFEDIANQFPEYPHVNFKLGYLHLIMRNYSRALSAFTKEIDGINAQQRVVENQAILWCSHAGRKEAYSVLKEDEKARHEQQLLMLSGGMTLDACVAMGSLFSQLGLLQRAQVCFELAATIDPKHPKYLVEHGKVLLQQHRPEKALAMFTLGLTEAQALSEQVFRAMIGQAISHIRLGHLAKAKNILNSMIESITPLVENEIAPLLHDSEMNRATLRQLYFQASQTAGCCALAAGDLKATLDVYYHLINQYSDFQLPVLLVTPGVRDATGEVVDTSLFSVAGIVNLLTYLDEIELRYGPDPCLYFHRACVYRALGNLKCFLQDLTKLEELNPNFISSYLHHSSYGDFLDEEIMTWLPFKLLCAIHEIKNHDRVQNAPLLEYFQERLHYQPNDIYAELYAIDCLRRLELLGEEALCTRRMQKAARVSLDDSRRSGSGPFTAKALTSSLLERHDRNPMAQFIAALVNFSQFFLPEAKEHCNCAIELLNDSLIAMERDMQGQTQIPPSMRWQYQSYTRAKYHALVWRSYIHRFYLNTSQGIDDLKTAIAILPRDPHALFAKAMLMLHFSQLRHAMEPLQLALEALKLNGLSKDRVVVKDYVLHAGQATFSLLPGELRREINAILQQYEEISLNKSSKSDDKRASLAAKIFTAEALDKLYEAGLLKLSKGLIAASIDYFEALLSIKESYTTRAIEAILDLQKCRDSRYVDEKIYACHRQLSQRCSKLLIVNGMDLEAYLDMVVCLHYAPHDIDIYFRRATLYRHYRNYQASLDDLCLAIELTLNGEKAHSLRGSRHERLKKMIQTRCDLYMHLNEPSNALSDINLALVLHHQEKNPNRLISLQLYEKRSSILVALGRFEEAIEEMQNVVDISNNQTSDKSIVNLLLVGNLHCQVAMHSSATDINYIFPTPDNPLPAMASESLTTAKWYYDEALKLNPSLSLAHFLKGRMYAFHGDCNAALESLNNCLRFDPSFVAAHFLCGSIRVQQCLPELALAEFLMVRHQVPTYPNVQTSIGYCYYLENNCKRAVIELTEAIKQCPDDITAFYTRGCALQEMLALNKAINDFNSVIDIKSDHYQAYYQRGICKLLMKEYINAIADLEQAYKLNPNSMVHALEVLGYIHYYLQQYHKAVQIYTQHLHEKATDPNVLVYRGLCYHKLQENDMALRDLHRAVKLDTKLWFGYFALAVVYQAKNDLDQMINYMAICVPHLKTSSPFQEPTASATKSHALFNYRNQATRTELLKLAKYSCSRSIQNLQQTRRANPQARQTMYRAFRRVVFLSRVITAMESRAFKATAFNRHISGKIEVLTAPSIIEIPRGVCTPEWIAWGYNLLGIMCHQHKKPQEALRNFAQAITAYPSNPVPFFNRGNVYFNMKAFSSALGEYKDGLKVDPLHIPCLINTALVHLELENLDEAYHQLKKASKHLLDISASTQQLVYYNLANISRALERYDEAVDLYTSCIEIEPKDLFAVNNRAATYHYQMKYSLALQDYELALQYEPEAFETRINRSQLFITSSKCFKAQQDIAIAIKQKHAPPSTLVQRLHEFCMHWSQAMNVALNDFLFAFHVFPCFSIFPMDNVQEPLLDPQFFHYTDLLNVDHGTTKALEIMLQNCQSTDLPSLLHSAIEAMKRMDYNLTERLLLTAIYSSNLSLEEIQVCLLWRAQIEFARGNVKSCMEVLDQLIKVTEPKDDQNSPSRTLHRWPSTLKSAEERVCIAADIYAYAGCVFYAQNQHSQAMIQLEKSLSLDATNLFAMLNSINLYRLEENYLAAIEKVLQAIEVVVNRLQIKQPLQKAKRNQVLNRQDNLSIEVMDTPEIIKNCCLIVSLLREYKSLLTWEVGNHIKQLCVLQGKLAIVVEALRDLIAEQRTKKFGTEAVPDWIHGLNLHPLHSIMDQCADEIIEKAPEVVAPKQIDSLLKSSRRQPYHSVIDIPSGASFHAEYERICSTIEASLADTEEVKVENDNC